MPKRLKPMKTDPNWDKMLRPAPLVEYEDKEWWSIHRIAEDTGADRQRVYREIEKKVKTGEVLKRDAIIVQPNGRHRRGYVYKIA